MDYIACQAPISLGFPRQEYWSGLPFPSLGVFLTQGSNLKLLCPLLGRQILYRCAICEAPFFTHRGRQVANPLATHQESVYMYQSNFLPLKPTVSRVSQVALVVKNLPANAGDVKRCKLIPGLGRSPGERHGNPLHYSCLENLHGQRSLADYRITESDTTEVT